MNPDLYQELVKQINSLQKQVDALVKPEVGLDTSIRPLFSAYNSATDLNVTGDGTVYTVICDTEIIDRNGNYNNGTGIFTAPVTSNNYNFRVEVFISGLLSTHTSADITLVTSNRTYYLFYGNPFAISVAGSIVLGGTFEAVDMEVGDTASFTVTIGGGTKVVDISANFTKFAGDLSL